MARALLLARGRSAAALQSPPTWSRPAATHLVADAMALFGYHDADLDRRTGYLRDLGWPHGGALDVVQGEDMGMRSRLHADIGGVPGSIRVGGTARPLS